MDSTDNKDLESQITQALKHPEAEDGLFFQNFAIVHESEDRQPVSASDQDLIKALESMVLKKQVSLNAMDGKVIFKLMTA